MKFDEKYARCNGIAVQSNPSRTFWHNESDMHLKIYIPFFYSFFERFNKEKIKSY